MNGLWFNDGNQIVNLLMCPLITLVSPTTISYSNMPPILPVGWPPTAAPSQAYAPSAQTTSGNATAIWASLIATLSAANVPYYTNGQYLVVLPACIAVTTSGTNLLVQWSPASPMLALPYATPAAATAAYAAIQTSLNLPPLGSVASQPTLPNPPPPGQQTNGVQKPPQLPV